MSGAVRKQWQMPSALGLVTSMGLVAALLCDGPLGDVLAVIALGAPLGVTIRFLRRSQA